jgi:bZIP factor
MLHCESRNLKSVQVASDFSHSDEAFVVLSRTTGWWLVQRNNPERGTVSRYPRKQGWVPSGALLEISIPVTTAIAEATTARLSIPNPTPISYAGLSKPILPNRILSASFLSVALKDYQVKGDGELDLNIDDVVMVYKRYNHWSYVGIILGSLILTLAHARDSQIVQDSGDRGWVPVSAQRLAIHLTSVLMTI